jgi:hypothetical protein
MGNLRVKYRRCASGNVVKVAAAMLAAVVVLPPLPGRSEPLAAIVPLPPLRTATPAATGQQGEARPIEWLATRGRECRRHRRGQRWYCQGPRRAPLPYGPAAELATALGLGELKTVSHLLLNPPLTEWVVAAGKPSGGPLLFPIDEGVVWRGLQRPRKVRGKFHPRHKGIDIGGRQGTEVRAVERGIVAYADNGIRGYGNLLVTVHGDGSVAFYAHCREVRVFPGQIVERGQVVAEVGQTGLARGPHLHFEYRVNGAVKDPRPRFESEPPPPLARAQR